MNKLEPSLRYVVKLDEYKQTGEPDTTGRWTDGAHGWLMSGAQNQHVGLTWIYLLTNLRTASQTCTSEQTLESRHNSDVCAARKTVLSKPSWCVVAQRAGGLNTSCESTHAWYSPNSNLV